MKNFIIIVIVCTFSISSISFAKNIDSLNNQKFHEMELKIAKLEAAEGSYSNNVAILLGYITVVVAIAGLLTYLITIKRISYKIKENKKMIDKFIGDYEIEKKELDNIITDSLMTVCNFHSVRAINFQNEEKYIGWYFNETASLIYSIKYIERIKDKKNESYVDQWINDTNTALDRFINYFENIKVMININESKDTKTSMLVNLKELIEIKSDIFRYKNDKLIEIYKEIEELN